MMCLAVPGKIIEIVKEDPMERAGKVSFGGISREVNLACVPEARRGDDVSVHVGMALGVVDEKEAKSMLDYIQSEDDLRKEGL